jgi:hypothetical protein
VNFEHFNLYTICALQYWYSQVLRLRSEADIDTSVRARWAVMGALRAVSAGTRGEPGAHLLAKWAEQKLPSEHEDRSLWRDASLAFAKGLQLARLIRERGGEFAEPTSIVGGVTVQMPWGFVIEGPYSTEFAMMRFSRRGVSDISTVLKPMVPGLRLDGTKKLTLNYVLSDRVDDVPGGKRLEATKSFKAAIRMLAGDNHPTRGRHCGRCAFLTICPSAPSR